MCAQSTILVTGPVATSAERDDLTAFAFGVCAQLGHAAVTATSTDIDVRDYAAVVVYGPSLSSPLAVVGTAMVLEAEAVLHDVPVIVPQHPSLAAPCDACGKYLTISTVRSKFGEPFCAGCWGDTPGCWHCFVTDGPTMPVYVNGRWEPQCLGCARITRVLMPSERNVMLADEDMHMMCGVAA
ncbi:hypothetical protein ACIQWV_18915 [Streptomyces sp. NPDC098085]|uniref:hypothetical protein n=1 Tax=Streptomyces sp. NPDC098085 TaxID=3366094 RepID=UPI0038021AA4